MGGLLQVCRPRRRVLTYLGRYVYRIAITDRRILSVDDGKVAFRYKKVRETSWRTMTVTAQEFIRRFLQHVLPKGLHKVRYYGLWAPSNKARLLQLRQRLTTDDAGGMLPAAEDSGEDVPPQTDSQPTRCPFCQKGTLLFLRRIPASQRSPP